MKFLQNKTIKVILGLVGLYFLSGGISYFAFSYFNQQSGAPISPAGLNQKRSQIDTTGPKTEECPLNGKLYTKAERDIWNSRRPLNVMIENHQDSRPQSGLSSADIVYEAVAEGGITRFMAVFFCGVSAKETQIGPVRSARIYFMDWASEYSKYPLYTHVGGANKPGPADALGSIKKYGWDLYNDMNQFSIGFPTFWRDYERLGHPVATEHTMYSTTDKLWKVANDRNLTNKDKDGKSWDEDFVKWKFIEAKPVNPPKVTTIGFPFIGNYPDYSVKWVYDLANNVYKRENGGQPHNDFNTEAQLITTNLVVIFVPVKGPIDELKHILYNTIGSGKVLVFQNGDVVEGVWKKESRNTRTRFFDKSGKEISFARGNIWISVVDLKTDVTKN